MYIFLPYINYFYHILFPNMTEMLLKIYQNKTKTPEELRKFRVQWPSLNIIFLKAQTNYPVETMSRLKLLYFDKYQTEVGTWPSASNRTSAVFKEHLVVFSLTFFAHASKMYLQPNINFNNSIDQRDVCCFTLLV